MGYNFLLRNIFHHFQPCQCHGSSRVVDGLHLERCPRKSHGQHPQRHLRNETARQYHLLKQADNTLGVPLENKAFVDAVEGKKATIVQGLEDIVDTYSLLDYIAEHR